MRFKVEHISCNLLLYTGKTSKNRRIFVKKIRAFQLSWAAILGYLEGCKIFNFFPNFYYVFSIYNSKLHDICSTLNLVYPPFKAKIDGIIWPI